MKLLDDLKSAAEALVTARSNARDTGDNRVWVAYDDAQEAYNETIKPEKLLALVAVADAGLMIWAQNAEHLVAMDSKTARKFVDALRALDRERT